MKDLLAQAEQADQTPVPDGMDLPAEIARRQERLQAMAQAKARIEERAQARFDYWPTRVFTAQRMCGPARRGALIR